MQTASPPTSALPRTERCDVLATVTVTAGLTHRCPWRDEIDDGTVEITWTTTDRTIEIFSLRDWLAGFAEVVISHEDLTAQIRRVLDATGVHNVGVVTRWVTARSGVQVALPR